MRSRFVRTAIAATGAVCLALPAFAQDSKSNQVNTKPKLPQWIVSCSNANAEAKLLCQMQQTLFISSTGQRVLSVTIEKIGKVHRATMLLPHGIDLTKQVLWAVDDGEKSALSVASADQNGSYFGFELTNDAIASLSAGKTLRVETQPLTGEELKIELSLSGFASAFEILQKN